MKSVTSGQWRVARKTLNIRIVTLLLLLVCAGATTVFGQTETATVSGLITDSQGAIVPDAEVQLQSVQRGNSQTATTNDAGIYVFATVQPGSYQITVRKQGFKQVDLLGMIVNVQDHVEQNFKLELGSVSESITVEGNGLNINTTDASVSTVVDRNFVESMPLNGRSFQSLILLAPGVITTTPQIGADQGSSGEFSVNGQRADANNFTVDGVSANNSPNPAGFGSQGSAGGLPATTALGTTQALLSIDALQEFKIQTSTYSAEYGRQPGAQISFETRSGTNGWHGSAFDYLRNDIFDANNWFNDHTTPPTPKPAERQNDFGGTLGGPLDIPWLYSGKDRTFFFFSYEGLRLTQPQPIAVHYVPSTQLRQQAPAALQPVLNAFPLPNCTTAMSSECVDPGNGLSPFLFSTSLPSNLDAISARVDERVATWLTLFFRYGLTDSSSEQSATIYTTSGLANTKTFTLGGESTVGSNITNQFRINYSPAIASNRFALPSYGGAVPSDILDLNGVQPGAGALLTEIFLPGYRSILAGGGSTGKQHQWNLIDTMTRKQGNHLLHFGLDYRRTNVKAQETSPEIGYVFESSSAILANSPEAYVSIDSQQYPQYTNFSAFVQDEWRATRSLNLSLGLRWELNPAPTVTSGPESRTINGNFDDPASLTLAPTGTPLYHTTYYNFAPRLGMAAILRSAPGHELVVRTGGGVFFDTGQTTGGIFGLGGSPGTGTFQFYPAGSAIAFPLTSSLRNLPVTSAPPYSTIYLTSQHLQLPYTFQWNVTMEQGLGKNQSISVGYIGSNGRRLLYENEYSLSGVNPLFNTVFRYQNGLSSSYNALQAQYKRTLAQGLQALASYTWSHALDYESQDSGFYPYQRGNSDFDVRDSLTTAISYDLPKHVGSRFSSALFGESGVDLRLTARTGFPVTLYGNQFTNAATGAEIYSGLDIVPGVPVYLYGSQYPGGRAINSAAFALPSGTDLGNAPRNSVRGFGENEINIAFRHDFPVNERLHLQFRAEVFNVLNHPNFGYIDPYFGDALFGQATSTLANSLGGLTPLYQQGGPRSFQFSLRIQF